MYRISLYFFMRRFLLLIGACAIGLFACTGAGRQSDVVVRSAKIADEADDYTYRADIPQVYGLTDAETQLLVNERLKTIPERQRRLFVRDAKNVSNAQTGATLKSGLTITYRVERADERALSMLFVVSPYFFGAENANHFTIPFNYDVERRREIRLEDVFTGSYLPRLSELSVERLVAQTKQDGTFSDKIARLIERGAAPRAGNFDSFSLKQSGIAIHFDPTDVAPYEQGIRQVTISGGLIGEHLTDTGRALLEVR